MKIFVILFAVTAIMIFIGLAFKRGGQNRRDITEIEKTELAEALKGSKGESSFDFNDIKLEGIGAFGSMKNTLAAALKWFGLILLFAGTIISFCSANIETEGLYSSQYKFSFLLFFTYELTVCSAGFLFIGLGEIIRLLNKIIKSLEKR